MNVLLERGSEKYNFYYHRERVFYCREDLARRAANITRKNLLSFGTCFGKFTKTRKFRLHVTALPYLSPYAKHRIWLKQNAEQSFLYGHHIIKSGLARVSDDTPQYAGVVVMNMNDIPLVSFPFSFLFKILGFWCRRKVYITNEEYRSYDYRWISSS